MLLKKRFTEKFSVSYLSHSPHLPIVFSHVAMPIAVEIKT